MRTIDLVYPETDPQSDLESVCGKQGLVLSAPSRLASYPGSLHWHISNPGLGGTLEVTWWPVKKRFWLKIASNREGIWIEDALKSFSAI